MNLESQRKKRNIIGKKKKFREILAKNFQKLTKVSLLNFSVEKLYHRTTFRVVFTNFNGSRFGVCYLTNVELGWKIELGKR